MTSLFLTVWFAFSSAAGVLVPAKPDFSGTWQQVSPKPLDPDLTWVIAQGDAKLTMTRKSLHTSGSVVFPLDGTELISRESGVQLTTSVVWQGDQLVLTERRSPPAKAYAPVSRHVLSIGAAGELLDEYTGRMDNLKDDTVRYTYRRLRRP
jgi:hypothetical protein